MLSFYEFIKKDKYYRILVIYYINYILKFIIIYYLRKVFKLLYLIEI